MQSKPIKETDPRDIFAIESLLAAHAEKAQPLAHDPAAAAPAPSVHVVPPISHVEPPPVEPAFRASDAREIPFENARASEIKVDVLKPPGAQPPSKWMKRVVLAVLVLLGVAAAAGWHQYGDQARAMAAEWAPPLMLAALPSAAKPAIAEQPSAPVAVATPTEQIAAQQPEATAADQPTPVAVAATAPAVDANQLQSMAQDLAAMGQQVEELKATIAQLKAGQAQMARELAKASEGKAAETRPAEQTLRPKVSALTSQPAQRPAPPPVRKPKPVASTYAPAYATAPVAAPPPTAAPLPPAAPAQAIADDGQPVVRPPMPLR